MKLIHLSDLHIGRRIKEYSMLEDQAYILKVILGIIDDEKPDGVIIAGDVYDKSVPSAEAVVLLDDFLYRIAERKIPAFIISGNHDSAERLSFGSRLMSQGGIHISPVYEGEVAPVTLTDKHGSVNIYMLPFVKPTDVRRYYPEEEISSYTDALRVAVNGMKADENERNILITHQFVTGAATCDSEDISVGGTDNVDVSVFDVFDYVALGHIHGPQKIARDTVRYCGTPLKYSFSEVNHKKSVTVVEMEEKGNVEIRTVPLVPLRDFREIKGKYEDIVLRKNYEGTNLEDYIKIVLTDEEEVYDVMGKLRVIYPNIMAVEYNNKRTQNSFDYNSAEADKSKSPFELFAEFYEKQNNQPMSEEQTAFMKELFERLREDDV